MADVRIVNFNIKLRFCAEQLKIAELLQQKTSARFAEESQCYTVLSTLSSFY